MGNATNFRFFSSNRGLAVGLAAGVMLTVSFATWASHDPIDPTTMTMFDNGDTITATPFNEMFTELYDWAAGVDAHLEMQEAEIADRVIDFSPCGETLPKNGDLGGYAAAADQCTLVDTCSDAARMCTGEEMAWHTASGGDLIGYAVGFKWVSSGAMSHSNTFGFVNDCLGWASTQHNAVTWHYVGRPDFASCANPLPILRCD